MIFLSHGLHELSRIIALQRTSIANYGVCSARRLQVFPSILLETRNVLSLRGERKPTIRLGNLHKLQFQKTHYISTPNGLYQEGLIALQLFWVGPNTLQQFPNRCFHLT